MIGPRELNKIMRQQHAHFVRSNAGGRHFLRTRSASTVARVCASAHAHAVEIRGRLCRLSGGERRTRIRAHPSWRGQKVETRREVDRPRSRPGCDRVGREGMYLNRRRRGEIW